MADYSLQISVIATCGWCSWSKAYSGTNAVIEATGESSAHAALTHLENMQLMQSVL